MAAERKFVMVQEGGLVLLPTNLGLKAGDIVAIEEIDEGVLLAPQNRALHAALDTLGEILRDADIDLETFIEEGRELRGDLLREHFGIDPDGQRRA